MELLSSLSGKLCEHSDISFCKRGDTMYTQKRCNERNYNTNPLSTKEVAHREKFAAVRAAVMARKVDPTKLAADQAAFKAQKKYKTMYSFLWNLEWEAYSAE